MPFFGCALNYCVNDISFVNFKFNSKNNTTPIGIKAIVEDDSSKRLFENNLSKGYQSSSEAVIQVGLGEKTEVKKVTFVMGNG